MKEVKDCVLRFRVTTEQKNKMMQYCEEHSIKVSEFIRIACEKLLSQEKG